MAGSAPLPGSRPAHPASAAQPLDVSPLSPRSADGSDRPIVRRSNSNGILIAVVIIVLAAVAYFVFAPHGAETPTLSEPAATTAPAAPAANAPAAPAAENGGTAAPAPAANGSAPAPADSTGTTAPATGQ